MIVTDKNVKDAMTGEIIAGKVVGYKEYEFEGIKIKIEIREDINGRNPLPFYPDFIANPIYTANGMPLRLCIEDACENAEPIERNRLIDCTDCIYFQRAVEKALFGFCKCEKNKKA